MRFIKIISFILLFLASSYSALAEMCHEHSSKSCHETSLAFEIPESEPKNQDDGNYPSCLCGHVFYSLAHLPTDSSQVGPISEQNFFSFPSYKDHPLDSPLDTIYRPPIS